MSNNNQKGVAMSEQEIFNQILTELKRLNNNLESLQNNLNANHDFIMGKLSTLESISDKSRIELEAIESNTKQLNLNL